MAVVRDEFDDIHDSEIQETFLERIEGLTEMFPDAIQSAAVSTANWSVWGIKGLFNATKSTVWLISTTSLIAFLPYIIEKERSDLEKTQVAQQRQMLLGPSAAIQQAKTN
uniref:Mitochondrial import receptor subunit TOM22 homolog n=1 Tax=Caenorhabditis japonica TaxID=281687 RepID=A0A8R1HLF8_CAEJA